MPGTRIEPLALAHSERSLLHRWACGQGASRTAQLRARIVLRCEQGGTLGEIAEEIGVSRDTVSKWRRRFLDRGPAGLRDDPRPGRPRTITDEQVARVIEKTFRGEPPDGDRRWSTRSVAVATGLSQSAICRIWNTLRIAPNPVRDWRLRDERDHGPRVRGLVGLCLGLPPDVLALCAPLPERSALPGPSASRRFVRLPVPEPDDLLFHLDNETRCCLEWSDGPANDEALLDFLRRVDDAVPPGLRLHLVSSDPYVYGAPAVRDWVLRSSRTTVHATTSIGPWQDLLHRWIDELGRHRLQKCSGHGLNGLRIALAERATREGSEHRPFVWVRPPAGVPASGA
jgi:transposase